MKRRILVVEDDAAIRIGVRDALRFAGYDVDEAADGDAGMTLALSVDCDLVLGTPELVRDPQVVNPFSV